MCFSFFICSEFYLPFGNKMAQHRETSKTYSFKSLNAYVNEPHKNVV